MTTLFNPYAAQPTQIVAGGGEGSGGPAPKKYTKVNGVMKLNPEYKRWKEAQDGKSATTSVSPNQALPVISNLEDHQQLNAAMVAGGEPEIPLADLTDATIKLIQEPEICLQVCVEPNTMVDELGDILSKYEVPLGLINKLMVLSEFEVLEFMVDDSGSMRLDSDTNGADGRPQSRWEEAHNRLKELLEILAYVPFTEIHICFLNRSDRVKLTRNGRDPRTFLADAYQQVDQVFASMPLGSTPFLEKLQESFVMGSGKRISRYFFGDGIPNGGQEAKDAIVRILRSRENPAGNPMTFLSCSNEDEQVEWMKDAEEVAPYCSEADDFGDEAREVLKDQGEALPFTRGFYLVCSLVAAMNPDDLDAMDESVPFTKTTLDNLLGIQHNEASYKHYFDCFTQAQKSRVVEVDPSCCGNAPKKADQLKKSMNWQVSYQEFLRAPVAKQIGAVQTFKQQLRAC